MKKVIVILLVIFLAVNAAIFGTMEERIKIEETLFFVRMESLPGSERGE